MKEKGSFSTVLTVIAGLSFLVGIISRILVKPVFGLESRTFAGFTAICLLFAIALLLQEKK